MRGPTVTRPTLGPEIVSQLEVLRAMPDAQVALLRTVLMTDDNRIAIDLIAAAAVQRSNALIDGFCALIERENWLCAAPLIRMQLDSAMRVYATSLVNNPETVLQQFLKGRPLNKIKDREGKSLTDAHLHAKLSRRIPWVRDVYEKASGFVHLSSEHLLDMVQAADKNRRSMSFRVGGKSRSWTPKNVTALVEAFTAATRLLTHIIQDWLHGKTGSSITSSTSSTA